MRRLFIAFGVLIFLASCGGDVVKNDALIETASRSAYSPGGQPRITLMTSIGLKDTTGGHTSLIINGSERVLWDPAGTWYHALAPEIGDVHYGFTPEMEQLYFDFHTRPEWHIVLQELDVTPETAEAILNAFAQAGPAAKSTCSRTTSSVLRTIPGFESLSVNWYPTKTMEQFAKLPGVRTFEGWLDETSPTKYRITPVAGL